MGGGHLLSYSTWRLPTSVIAPNPTWPSRSRWGVLQSPASHLLSDTGVRDFSSLVAWGTLERRKFKRTHFRSCPSLTSSATWDGPAPQLSVRLTAPP